MVRTAAADFVRDQMREAQQQGARALIDPRDFPAARDGTAYVAPQVLVDVDHSHAGDDGGDIRPGRRPHGRERR